METETATCDASLSTGVSMSQRPTRSALRRASTGSVKPMPSRHIDFQGDSQDDGNSEAGDVRHVRRKRASDGGAHVTFSRWAEEDRRFVRTPEKHRQEESSQDRAWSDDDDSESAHGPQSPRSTPGRRPVVRWTRREEQCVIDGVKTFGLGQWRNVLEQGKGVFHRQRTNVDLKDKWKHLVKKVLLTAEEEENVDTRIWRDTVAARTIERMLPSLRQAAEDSVDADDEDDDADATRAKRRRLSHGTESIQFYVGTDASAPHKRTVTVLPRDCPTISTLKRVLARKLLDDAPLPTNLQLVSLQTRRLLGDFESVQECAAQDGRELYFLYDP